MFFLSNGKSSCGMWVCFFAFFFGFEARSSHSSRHGVKYGVVMAFVWLPFLTFLKLVYNVATSKVLSLFASLLLSFPSSFSRIFLGLSQRPSSGSIPAYLVHPPPLRQLPPREITSLANSPPVFSPAITQSPLPEVGWAGPLDPFT